MTRHTIISKSCAIVLLVGAIIGNGVALAEEINVISFGAIPDDKSSDEKAINKAIRKAGTGDTVYIPPGLYLTSGVIKGKNGITLSGAGRGKTILRAKGAGWLQSALINIDSITGMTIRDMSLDGNWNSGIPFGILGSYDGGKNTLTNLSIERLRAQDKYGSGPNGILISDQPGTTIVHTVIHKIKNNKGDGAGIGLYGGPYTVQGNAILDVGRNGLYALRCSGTFSDNRVDRSGTGSEGGDTGLSIELHGGDGEGGCENFTVENNYVDSWISVVNAANGAIRNNQIGQNRGDQRYAGIEVSGENLVVSNNRIDKGVHTGIIVERPSYNIAIDDNQIDGTDSLGISVIGGRTGEDPKGWMVEDVYIGHNDISGVDAAPPNTVMSTPPGSGIEITRNAFKITLADNTVSGNGGDGLALFKEPQDQGPGSIFLDKNRFTDNQGNTFSYNSDPEFSKAPGSWKSPPLIRVNPAINKPSLVVPTKITHGQAAKFSIFGEKTMNIADALWDFGEGTPRQGSSVAHVFRQPGTYPVSLTYWLDNGVSAQLNAQLIVH